MSTRRILVLSGPTREYLDPVRYLTNASSGRQGIALAEEALARGHGVELIQGPIALKPPPHVPLFPVVTAEEMLRKAQERHPHCDVLICAAAICDYRPASTLARKRKRHDGSWTLDLVPNEDVLGELGRQKQERIHIGFALETEDLLENGRRKLEAKNLDWIIANSPEAIDAEIGDYLLLGADGSQRDLGRLSKEELAKRLVDLVEEAP